MRGLFSAPLRVYVALGALAFAGILSGLKLPISLFPNSSRPSVSVNLNYRSMTSEEFLNNYGKSFEERLRSLSTPGLEVEELKAFYDTKGVSYRVLFKWGSQPQEALKEVEATANAFAAQLPKEIQDSMGIWMNNENSGFFTMTFYSDKRSLDELYSLMEPVLMPAVSRNGETSELYFFNPSRKEIRIELIPEKLAALRLMPNDIQRAVTNALGAMGAGSVEVGSQQMSIQIPRAAPKIEDLGRVLVVSSTGRTVHLSDVARIDLGPELSRSRVFKTSGTPSLMLYATPKPGGNIKKMSEDILAATHTVLKSLPNDIQFKVLVDPSEFIRSSVSNVMHEVLIGALLAVVILYIFIGSLRNTITAAIEIPLSMVLAFILMKLTGMNLNLISLGGLALSAGMNVDASVVVMENIFRHFEHVKDKLSAQARMEIVIKAVREVWFPVVASTVSSLVVFLPLAFTSDLSYAILGDLAKTVIFSHGFSAIVALILVPTVRLQLMSGKHAETSPKSPIESSLKKLEQSYARTLGAFIDRPKLRWGVYGGVAAALALLFILALPRLPREVIGTPDSDFIYMGVNARGNTLMKQAESQVDEVEAKLLAKFGDKIQYTFVQLWGTGGGSIMARLKDKKQMEVVWKAMEAEFVNTPLLRFHVSPWNPAELPIPDPPQLKIAISGSTSEERTARTQSVLEILEEKQIVQNIWSEPDVSRGRNVILSPHWSQWVSGEALPFSTSDIADFVRVATNGKRIGDMDVDGRSTSVNLRFPFDRVASVEDIASLPVGIGTRIVPLRAFADVSIQDVPPTMYRENARDAFWVMGRKSQGQKIKTDEIVAKAKEALKDQPGVVFDDAEKELNDAIHQLGIAVGLSVLMIFLTMVLQFGDVVNSLLVLVAIPLGLLGVLLSLTIFRSTLSLNSILGVILLNGIAVANSIILVDFIKRLVNEEGMSPREAALEAGRKRLRPILITSLTTILGMMPIALGFGEGGRILQPLGIAVSGGLWVSMTLTLFIVPALQVAYLNHGARPRGDRYWRPKIRRVFDRRSGRIQERPVAGVTGEA